MSEEEFDKELRRMNDELVEQIAELIDTEKALKAIKRKGKAGPP
jgi:hypothetical protein